MSEGFCWIDLSLDQGLKCSFGDFNLWRDQVTNEHLESVEIWANDMLFIRDVWVVKARQQRRNGPLLWLGELRGWEVDGDGCLVQ
jgi:hypothetical protein